MSILQIQGLYKKFGQNNIINGLDLEVRENTIFGFIGENGAGKTTTMKMILGFLKQDSGVIKVCGEEVKFGETKTNKFIGYLPDVPKYYGYMTPLEYLKLCGEITNMKKDDIKKKSEELLELVGLSDYKKRKISKFSRGMKQRLGIAQALLNEPKLLICDEPTSALDPIGRKEILDILLKVKERTTVIFSTHILSDVERICDEIAILRDGKITLNGTPITNSINTSSTSSNEYSVTFMQPLTAGDILALQLYGVNGPVSLQAGTGASLNVVKIA